MIATSQDLLVLTRADFDRLPEDGIFEVVDGRAILMPGNGVPHQKVVMALYEVIRAEFKSRGRGYLFPAVNVFIPRQPGSLGEIQNRVPDLAISTFEPASRFEAGSPPELVIEVLSTRRGNVERTEKLDDYARARIGEYWIVNPFDRVVEVYRLEGVDYALQEETTSGPLSPAAFPDVHIDLRPIWAAFGQSV